MCMVSYKTKLYFRASFPKMAEVLNKCKSTETISCNASKNTSAHPHTRHGEKPAAFGPSATSVGSQPRATFVQLRLRLRLDKKKSHLHRRCRLEARWGMGAQSRGKYASAGVTIKQPGVNVTYGSIWLSVELGIGQKPCSGYGSGKREAGGLFGWYKM